MEDSQEHKQRGKPSRRDLQKERLWRRRLEEQRGSGLSVRAYCRRGGFGEALFYWWRREIAKRAGGRCGRGGLALPLPPEGPVPGALAPPQQRLPHLGRAVGPVRSCPGGAGDQRGVPHGRGEGVLAGALPPLPFQQGLHLLAGAAQPVLDDGGGSTGGGRRGGERCTPRLWDSRRAI